MEMAVEWATVAAESGAAMVAVVAMEGTEGLEVAGARAECWAAVG